MPLSSELNKTPPVPQDAIQSEELERVRPSMQNRRSLTLWITPETIAAWHAPLMGQRRRAFLDKLKATVLTYPGVRPSTEPKRTIRPANVPFT